MAETPDSLPDTGPVSGPIYSIGHSTRPLADFLALLREHGVDGLADVRAHPGSRTNPQYRRDSLARAMAEAGIAYRHLGALGGRRRAPAGADPSPNRAWTNAAFRAYADHAMTDTFRDGLARLKALARDHVCAVMCAEAVWWRCHRRIIADYLIADGIPVLHIMGAGTAAPAAMTPGARRAAPGVLVYDG